MSTPLPMQSVVLVDLRIPFFRLVFFFVKAALAAIPAAIILAVLATIVTALIAAFFGGHIDVMMREWKL